MAGILQKLKVMFTGGLSIGVGGTHLKKAVISSIANVNPGNIAATTRSSVNFALAGAKVGDTLIMQPPAGLHDDLLFCGAAVTADNVATIYLYNPTGAGIDDAALTWVYTWIKKG